MFRQLSLLLGIFVAVHGNGEFAVLHSSDSIQFIEGDGGIEQSSLKEILSAALGYTGKQKDTEHSITILNPFAMPKALVAIAIDGVETLPVRKDMSKVKFPLIVDEVEETTWQAIRSRVEERSSDNTLVRINLSDGVDALGQSALGELKPSNNMEKLKVLSSEVEEDRKFIEEIQLLHAIADNASATKVHDSGTNVVWLVISAFKPVLDLHGNNSAAIDEAYMLLNNAVERISKVFEDVYKGQVIITAFTNDATKVRNARSAIFERQIRDTEKAYKTNSVKTTGGAKGAPINSDFNNNLFIKQDGDQDPQNNIQEEKKIKDSMSSTSESNTIDSTTERTGVQDDSWTSEKSDLDSIHKEYKTNTNTQTIGQEAFSGRSKIYTDNYPVIFNILLWFGIVMFFSLLAICIAIANMDPGRDSIIYRMTSNRMKKDN